VQYILPVAVQLMFFASPVAYPKEVMGDRAWLMNLNPVTPFIELAQHSLLGRPSPDILWLLYGIATGGAILLIGLIAFRQMERKFADVI
jgi:lipopolysaccharide transport system permease protein